MAIIISADEIKKQLPNYSPDKAEEFHRQSTKQADKAFEEALRKSSFQEVILLSGGAASGKTEFLVTELRKKEYIIFDSTLDSTERAQIKIRSILRRKKQPIIYAVFPDDLKRAFVAFLNRDRKFSDEHFYRTHSGSRKVLLWILTEHPEIEINLIESSYTPEEKLHFLKIEFDTKEKLAKYLTEKQLSENDIIKLIQG